MRSASFSFKNLPGFSLVEVAMAMGILAFAVMGLLGLLVIGFGASKDSEGDVRTALIASKVFGNVKAEIDTSANFQSPPAPWQAGGRDYWFDDRGIETTNQATRFFLAHVTVAPLAQYPANMDQMFLKSVCMELTWPVPSGATSAPASARKASFTRLLRNPGNYTP